MWRLAGLFGALGMEVAIAVMLSTWVGYQADARLETAPWGVLAGFAVGIGASVLGVLRAMRAAHKILSRPS